jgi:pyruvate dehydrogenase E2 component (dihydrolipoamide acetyltransferase)
MPFDFKLPDIGEGVAEGEVVQWFVKEGDTVREDQPLVSVLTDKANVEIPSPKSGTIAKIHAQVGEKVKVGGLLVSIETQPGGGGGSPPSAPAPPGASETPHAAPAAPAANAAPAAQRGARATADRPTGGPALASPYVRRLATERGIDLGSVRGSGPGGRIVESDLGPSGYAGSASVAIPSTAIESAPLPASAPTTAPRGEPTVSPTVAVNAPAAEIRERIPIRGIRRVISEHMTEATHRAAHYTYVEEVDASELVRLRDRMAKHVEKQGTKLSYLPFIVKAVVASLKAVPKLNATMDDARQELIVRSAYHIGIAAAAPEGLIVPVVRNADAKSVTQLAREIQDLAERGKAGKLTRGELTGSTFTITSLGALGGVLATPILNYPEVGILGVHKIQTRPVYRPDGSVGPADLMNLSVSLDHRVVDGIEGARFLAAVKGYLEDPHQLFAELA